MINVATQKQEAKGLMRGLWTNRLSSEYLQIVNNYLPRWRWIAEKHWLRRESSLIALSPKRRWIIVFAYIPKIWWNYTTCNVIFDISKCIFIQNKSFHKWKLFVLFTKKKFLSCQFCWNGRIPTCLKWRAE